MTEVEKYIRKYLDDCNLMQLGTVGDDNKPWVCTVWFAHDKDMNIYWFSSTKRRHSVDVKTRPSVSAAFCIPKSPDDGGRGGLQVEGEATLVKNPVEIAKATKLYVDKKYFHRNRLQTL